MLLKLLSPVKLFIISFRSQFLIIFHVIFFFWLFIKSSRTERNWSLWNKFKFFKNPMNSICACSTDSKPVLKSMFVQYHLSLNSHSLSRKPISDLFKIATSRVFVCRLNNNPPIIKKIIYNIFYFTRIYDS